MAATAFTINGKADAVQATNFDIYPVMRMSKVSEIHTKIVATDNPASGIAKSAL